MRLPGYTLVAHLGRGARSTIVQVVKDDTGETFALKEVERRGPGDDRYFEQVENEFRISSKVRHETLRKSYEMHRIRRMLRVRYLLILMEYVEGSTLEQDRPTDLLEVIRVFHKVAEGLDALHTSGYVHADVKPNNILRCPDGRVKLIDFGQSCPIGHIKARIQGTPDYIAPEQAHRRPIDRRTDVFNLGAALYWVVTGQPIPTVLPSQFRRSGSDILGPGDAIPPHDYNPAVPPSFSNLIMDCCAQSPLDRPADMREILARLSVARHIILRNGDQGAESEPTPAGGPGSNSPEED